MRTFLLALATILCIVARAAASNELPPLSIGSINIVNEHCGEADGAIDAYANGGTPPYNYNWSPIPPIGQGTSSVAGLSAGDWTLTVTDAMAQQTSQVFTIQALSYLDLFLTPAQDGHANCPGHCWGEFRVPESYLPGVGPYSYSEPVQGYDQLGEPYFYVPGGACGGASYPIKPFWGHLLSPIKRKKKFSAVLYKNVSDI